MPETAPRSDVSSRLKRYPDSPSPWAFPEARYTRSNKHSPISLLHLSAPDPPRSPHPQDLQKPGNLPPHTCLPQFPDSALPFPAKAPAPQRNKPHSACCRSAREYPHTYPAAGKSYESSWSYC